MIKPFIFCIKECEQFLSMLPGEHPHLRCNPPPLRSSDLDRVTKLFLEVIVLAWLLDFLIRELSIDTALQVISVAAALSCLNLDL